LKKDIPKGFFVSNTYHRPHRTIRSIIGFSIVALLFAGVFIIVGFFKIENSSDIDLIPMTQEELFNQSLIRDIHIKFTDSAWFEMQPYGGPFGIDGEGEGWRDFGQIFAQPYMIKGDVDNDGKLSRNEFKSLSERWF